MADRPAIETVDLRKAYGSTEALRGLTLAVPRGSICGFLGRNGSGKTTTLKVLLGMIRPTSGSARVLGLAADQSDASVGIRSRTGFVSESKDLYDYMTVGDMVAFTASFFPRWRQDLQQRYLTAFDLAPHQPIKTLSLGMRSKLSLLLALCRGAEMLILDEPTTGLDPAAIEQVLQAIVSHAASDGVTVFFSSHQIAEVEQIADRVVIIERGRTVLEDGLDELRAHYRRVHFVFAGDAPHPAFRAAGVRSVQHRAREIAVLTSGDADLVIAEGQRLGATSVETRAVTLKDIFLEAIQRED